MIFNINNFRAVTSSGYQKLEHYRIRFPIPPILNSPDTTNVIRDLEFYADSVDLPGVALMTRDVSRYGYGHSEKKPVSAAFNDVMITFYADSQSDNLSFFHNWLLSISNFNLSNGINPLNQTAWSPMELAFKDDYAVSAWISLFDPAGDLTYSMTYREMYPTHIVDTKYGFALTQDIARITVIFTYFDWYPGSVDIANAPFLGAPINAGISTLQPPGTGSGTGTSTTGGDITIADPADGGLHLTTPDEAATGG